MGLTTDTTNMRRGQNRGGGADRRPEGAPDAGEIAATVLELVSWVANKPGKSRGKVAAAIECIRGRGGLGCGLARSLGSPLLWTLSAYLVFSVLMLYRGSKFRRLFHTSMSLAFLFSFFSSRIGSLCSFIKWFSRLINVKYNNEFIRLIGYDDDIQCLLFSAFLAVFVFLFLGLHIRVLSVFISLYGLGGYFGLIFPTFVGMRLIAFALVSCVAATLFGAKLFLLDVFLSMLLFSLSGSLQLLRLLAAAGLISGDSKLLSGLAGGTVLGDASSNPALFYWLCVAASGFVGQFLHFLRPEQALPGKLAPAGCTQHAGHWRTERV